MIDLYYSFIYYLTTIFSSQNLIMFFAIFFPFVFILEMPFILMTTLYSIKGWIYMTYKQDNTAGYYPIVSVVISAYNESMEEIFVSMQSVAEQIYPGKIETLVIVDNALVNEETVLVSEQIAKRFNKIPNREFIVISKKSRGGHASSMNLGLKLAKGEVMVMLDADTSIDNQSIAKAAAHFINPNVIAVSGAVRVRNIKDSIITRLQTLEYMVGIQLARFGLTELNVTNTISGAFGIFRTSFLRQIGGWLNGAAEDLDLTLRIHVYISRYPHLKMIHEPYAISWTAVPKTLRTLMKQRLRWDGDLFYIYVRRHWRKFSPKIMSRTKMFFFTWYGLYYQLVLPFIIVFYTAVMFIKFSFSLVLVITFMIYIYYLVISLLMFLLFLVLVSERPRQDFLLIGWLLLMPIYQQMLRFTATVFIMNEVLFSGHKETSMAPWWILRKTK